MSTSALKSVAAGHATKPTTFPDMLKAYQSEIARALPRHLNPDRLARIALTEFRKNPKLGECDPRSVFAAVIQASQLGLEPGLMGQAYLIPYKTECQLIPGYQGLIDLVRRTGMIKRIEAHVVRDGDRFTYRTGMTTTLEHEPMLDGDPGELRLAYAVAEFTDGGYHVEVMTRAQIEAIRDRSQGYQMSKRYNRPGPWDTDTEEMWRKTVIRRICKYLPKSAELSTALALDDAANTGGQHISPQDAIEGTWAPVVTEDSAPAEQPVRPEVQAVEPALYVQERSEIAALATQHELTLWLNAHDTKVKRALRDDLEAALARIKTAQEVALQDDEIRLADGA